MTIKVFSVDRDEVVDSYFITGRTNYQFAIENFISLIDRLEIQRKGQSPKFYQRLENDILNGCVMPPLTLAFVGLKVEEPNSRKSVESLINENINSGFILDGLQRMKTIERASQRTDITIDAHRPVFVNILLCDSMDKLLYRMITLNNGQKPMTARHQIEIIASNLYDFDNLKIDIQTEKERAKKIVTGSFNKADFIKAYLAFLSKSTNIDNTRIIESKMDELIADKILQTDIKEQKIEFSQIVELIEIFTQRDNLKKWFKNVNNLIGFSSAADYHFSLLKSMKKREFEKLIETYEDAFNYFDVSKIKVGLMRRKTLNYLFKHLDKFIDADDSELIDEFSQIL